MIFLSVFNISYSDLISINLSTRMYVLSVICQYQKKSVIEFVPIQYKKRKKEEALLAMP
ncbi:hypothetical protein DOY81_011966, partial [Sarcophaga bullata]